MMSADEFLDRLDGADSVGDDFLGGGNQDGAVRVMMGAKSH